MAALRVEEALQRILEGVAPTDCETVAIAAAHRRTLAEPLAARLTQPPFDASAMDGYAVRAADVATLPATLAVIGEAAAGHPFSDSVDAGQTVRIFTGAPLPAGTDAVVIQEDTARDGGKVIVRAGRIDKSHVRTRGFDFREGETLLAAGRRLGAREVALAAAMGYGALPVRRRPRVAILSTGDELVPPGQRPGPGQIISSNHLGVAALAEAAGAETRLLGIARDTRESLDAYFAEAQDADVIVTIGGASVGDHDLVKRSLEAEGVAMTFWRIAMRPGKPMMHGRLGAMRVIGLPGNPVSSYVCGFLFLVPLIRALSGRDHIHHPRESALLGRDLAANDQREDYLRARLEERADGTLIAIPVSHQDSSLLGNLAAAQALVIRPPFAPAAAQGSPCELLRLPE
jgi:molybdopterin molybdotransferase